MTQRGLILDVDNTLYSWVDAFLPSFRAMLHILAQELRVSEDELTADFRTVYQIHGTVEYPLAVEELPLWQRVAVAPEDRVRILSRVQKVFSINYRRNLRLFPHVEEVLKWTRREGIVVVGLSDALERWVVYRLRALGISRYFHGLYTWHEEPWFEGRRPLRSTIRKLVRLSSTELKPNKEVVWKVLQDFSLDRQGTFMVGDSLSKDIAAARNAGVNDVWARYGTRPSELNLDTLRLITPWTDAAKGAEKAAVAQIIPTHVIDDFADLKAIIGSRNAMLFEM